MHFVFCGIIIESGGEQKTGIFVGVSDGLDRKRYFVVIGLLDFSETDCTEKRILME